MIIMAKDDYESVEIAAPAVTMKAIGKVARALYALNKASSYKEISSGVGMSPQHTSQTLSAAKDLGVTESASGRGKHVLTQMGASFARLLGFGKEEESRQVIAHLIKTQGPWSEVVSFLKMNEGVPRSPLDLVLHIEARLGKRWANAMRSRIASSYRSILVFAGLVKADGGDIVSLIGMEDEVSAFEEPNEVSTRDVALELPSLSPQASYTSRFSDYAEFSIPDFFKMYVRRTLPAVAFLRNELREESTMVPWLNALEKSISEKEENENETE